VPSVVDEASLASVFRGPIRPRHTRTVDESSLPPDSEVSAAADVIREFGHYAGRRFYAGVTPDHAGGSVTVHRLPDRDFDGEVRALVPRTVMLAFADAPHTRDELIAARETVWLLGETLHVQSVSLPQDGTTLTVVVEADADAAQRILDEAAPHLVRVELGTTVASP